MKKKNKFLNWVQVFTNLLLIINLILVIVLNESFLYSIFWFIIPINILSNVFFINKWSKGGANLEKKKSREVYGSFDNFIVVSMVFYALVYLGLVLLNFFDIYFANNLYVLIAFYLLTLVYQISIYLAVKSTYKKTVNLINKK